MKKNNLEKISRRIGVMQGRLVDQEEEEIQSFPWKSWDKEFKLLRQNRFNFLEWTIDNEDFFQNPINNEEGRKKIKKLKKKFNIKIQSCTADFFMQKPFFKEKSRNKINLSISKLKNFLTNLDKIKIKYAIIPLVDNSSLKKNYINFFIKEMSEIKNVLKNNNQMILFESDFVPKNLLNFIKRFDTRFFGINYDTGNSASLGYKFEEEISYFKFVKNIHIKDRFYKGNTTRLGKGCFNFKKFFEFILRTNYKGNFILQTARAKNKKHVKEILLNRNYIIKLF